MTATLGELIRNARTNSHITSYRLGKSCGLDVPTISKIENHRAMPTGDQLDRICRSLLISRKDAMRLTAAEYGLRVPSERGTTVECDTIYKFTARLGREKAKKLDDAVHSIGYDTVQAWFMDCVNNLIREKEVKE